MNGRVWFLAALLAGAGACDADAGPGGSGSPGTGGSGPGRTDGGAGRGGTGGSSGGGGSTGGTGAGTGGSGGGFGVGGSGGASGGSGGFGTGGSGPGQDASSGSDGAPVVQPDAGADAPGAPSCAVSIAPLAPQRLSGLPAAPGSKLRVGATAMGQLVPMKPMFAWTVTYNGTTPLPTTVVGGDPAVVEFETVNVGQYVITVTVVGVTPPCVSPAVTASAQPLNDLVARYRIRATAPEGRGLAPLETDLPVSVGSMPVKTLELNRGREITVTAVNEQQAQLPAYFVQLRSRTSTARLEGFVDNTGAVRPVLGFKTRVDESQRHVYDLLVIPAPGTTAGVRPPRLYPGLFTEQIQLQDFVMSPGTLVTGTVFVGDTPVPGARVRLRDGLLPSTVGDSAASGAYELRVRGGRFEVRVLPPATRGLPEAQLPESAGVNIPEGSPPFRLDFRYTEQPTSNLNVTIQGPAGAAATGPFELLLQSLEGELPNVGSFTLPASMVAATGSVRILKTSPGNTTSFEAVPRVRYRLTVAPPATAPGNLGITTVMLDLRAAGATQAQTVSLQPRIPVRGRLTELGGVTGLRVRAVDAAEDGLRRTVIVTVAADGSYEIPADAGRLYRLSVEPSADGTIPRIPLLPVRGMMTATPEQQRLPRSLRVTGTTRAEGTAIPGVVIQIYCLGSAPDCVAEESPDITNTLPIDETVSAPDGSYELRVPEPN